MCEPAARLCGNRLTAIQIVSTFPKRDAYYGRRLIWSRPKLSEKIETFSNFSCGRFRIVRHDLGRAMSFSDGVVVPTPALNTTADGFTAVGVRPRLIFNCNIVEMSVVVVVVAWFRVETATNRNIPFCLNRFSNFKIDFARNGETNAAPLCPTVAVRSVGFFGVEKKEFLHKKKKALSSCEMHFWKEKKNVVSKTINAYLQPSIVFVRSPYRKCYIINWLL